MEGSEVAATYSAPRRQFLGIALSLFGLAASGVATLWNVLRYLIPGRRVARIRKIYVAPLAALPESGVEMLDLRGRPLIVVPNAGQAPLALSLVCTHLGCRVHREQDGTFFCPCHDGRFDSKGKVTGGPPPSPLTHYQVVVNGEAVYLELEEA